MRILLESIEGGLFRQKCAKIAQETCLGNSEVWEKWSTKMEHPLSLKAERSGGGDADIGC